jgi:hypothetical protein
MEANDKLRVARESKGLTQTNSVAICNVALRTLQYSER